MQRMIRLVRLVRRWAGRRGRIVILLVLSGRRGAGRRRGIDVLLILRRLLRCCCMAAALLVRWSAAGQFGGGGRPGYAGCLGVVVRIGAMGAGVVWVCAHAGIGCGAIDDGVEVMRGLSAE